ncbi:MAG: S46 family peptidase [bacterium]|nr:S46 family peptidase [bacterium]
MLRFFRTIILVTLILFAGFAGYADEGMWMPHQMKDLNLEKQGLKMNPGDLYKKDGTGIMSAVIYLGGGTGEFVSPKGLMLTNHHVAFGALQRASDKDHDYIKDGFLAKSLKEEIPAGGYNADVLLGYEDITKEILKAVKPRMTPLQKYNAIDRMEKRLIAKAEKEAKDRRCIIKKMYSGNQYYLFKFKRLRDLRIAYAPPRSIGNFGGDIDNWMWPRHTGDFTYLRAYVSKNNEGAEYSPENVPYEPKVFLKVSKTGVKEGDFTFVMGYPGRTYRNFTLSELQGNIDTMKARRRMFLDMIRFFEDADKGNRAIQIKYAALIKGMNNALKNYQGKFEGMEKVSLADKKKAAEKKFTQWLSQNPEKEKKYGTILKQLDDFMKIKSAFYRKYNHLVDIVHRRSGASILSQANTIYRTVVESQKPDMKREPRYQKRDLPDIKMRIKLAERRYDPDVDKAFTKHMLKWFLEYPEDERPAACASILAKGKDGVDKYVDMLYAKTVLTDPQKRLELIKLKPAKLMKLKDPFIAFAAEIEKEAKVLREKKKAIDQEHEDLKSIYMEALLDMHKGAIAPDANSSIRFTSGAVAGYSPKDAVFYSPLTTLKGVMEKETGKFPFVVPEKLKALHKARDFGEYAGNGQKDVVTCLLNSANVTGGSSGSPVLNAKGEQVGIVFDMTYESVIGDYYIVPELQRTIQVDIRYVLFVTEKLAGAHHLLKEMGL